VVALGIAGSLPAVATARRDATRPETQAIMKALGAPPAATTCLYVFVSTVNSHYAKVIFGPTCAKFKRQVWYKLFYAEGAGEDILLLEAGHWLELYPVRIGAAPTNCKDAAEGEGIPTSVARDLQVCLD
jgi:hypothetical protein